MKVDTKIEDNGKKYELLSHKVEKENGFRCEGKYIPGKTKIYYEYVLTEDNGNPIRNLQADLENLGSFGSLSRQKVVARLSHLQSEIKFMINAKCNEIEVIDEKGHEGCGFVPPGKFYIVCGCKWLVSHFCFCDDRFFL